MPERFHVAEYLRDELEARNWTTRDCAARMGGDVEVDQLALDILLALESSPDNRVRLGEEVANGLAVAFGTSPETWLNLDRAYHAQ